jgi:hypothetical protein
VLSRSEAMRYPCPPDWTDSAGTKQTLPVHAADRERVDAVLSPSDAPVQDNMADAIA